MYYIIETKNTGPNQADDKHIDSHIITIETLPALGNSSGDPVIEGWAGTTNDWAVYGHGEYSTPEEAEKAVQEKFGKVRELDERWIEEQRTIDTEGEEINHVVAGFRVGEFEPMSASSTADWCSESINKEITANTTDQEIQKLINELEGCANEEGSTLDKNALEGYMEERRQELKDELDYAEE